MGYVTQIFLLFTNNTGIKKKNPVLIFSKRDCLFIDWKSTPTSLPDFPKTVLRFVETERL